MKLVTASSIPYKQSRSAYNKLKRFGYNPSLSKDGIHYLSFFVDTDDISAINIIKKALSFDENHWEFKHTTFEVKDC